MLFYAIGIYARSFHDKPINNFLGTYEYLIFMNGLVLEEKLSLKLQRSLILRTLLWKETNGKTLKKNIFTV